MRGPTAEVTLRGSARSGLPTGFGPGLINRCDQRRPPHADVQFEKERAAVDLRELSGVPPGNACQRPASRLRQACQTSKLLAAARTGARGPSALCGLSPDQGFVFDTVGLADLSQPVGDWNKSCLAQSADRSRFRPAYPGADFTTDSVSDTASTRVLSLPLSKQMPAPSPRRPPFFGASGCSNGSSAWRAIPAAALAAWAL